MCHRLMFGAIEVTNYNCIIAKTLLNVCIQILFVGELRRKLLDELMTDKVIFRPPSPKLQLPVNIMDELKNLAPPTASSSTTTRSNGISKPTSKTASPSTNTTAPRSTTLRTNVYSDPDLRRSHSNGAPFPSSHRADNGRAELPTIRRQSTGCPQSQTTEPSSGFYHHHQKQEQQSNQNAWNQSHDQSQPEARPYVFNHSAFSSGQHESNSYSDTTMDRPNWLRIHSESNQRLGHAPQTNSVDGFGSQSTPENLCESGYNQAYPPPPERHTAVDLGFENSNESFHLGRQSNAGAGFPKQISREAYRHGNSPANFASQNSQEPFVQPGSSHPLSFGLQSSRDTMRSLDSQQTPTSQLSQVSFWPDEAFRQANSPAAFAKQTSLSNFRQNSLSEVHENPSELPVLQKSVSDQSALETGDPRNLKGSRTRDKDSKDARQKHEDQTKRQQSQDTVDFRKSSSHDMEVSRDSKHGSRRHDSSRHRNRNHDSSHGKHRSHHKKHHSHHRHRSTSRESSSKLSVSRDSSDQHKLSTPVLPDLPQALAPPLPPDCLPPSNVILPSLADSSLPHPSLESRIQQLLGQAEERSSVNGFSGLVFPPPLPPEQPPPPPPPAEAKLPPLPPEPAPPDEVVDMVSMGPGLQRSGQNNSMFPNYSEKTNYIYSSSVNCKAGKTKAGSMSRYTGSLPGTFFNGKSYALKIYHRIEVYFNCVDGLL